MAIVGKRGTSSWGVSTSKHSLFYRVKLNLERTGMNGFSLIFGSSERLWDIPLWLPVSHNYEYRVYSRREIYCFFFYGRIGWYLMQFIKIYNFSYG